MVFYQAKLKGRNFIWNLHAVVGTWAVVFYLLFACTGLYWSYDWWRAGMFKVMGVEQPQRKEHDNEGGQAKQPELSKQQINTILEQTWTNVNAQIGGKYSPHPEYSQNDDAKLSYHLLTIFHSMNVHAIRRSITISSKN